MTRKRTLITVVAAVAVGLGWTGSALASYVPKLVVATGVGGAARIGVSIGAADTPTARTTIYVPTGYAVAAPAPGTKLGDVTASAQAADFANLVIPVTGELDAIAPTATTAAVAQACGVTPAQTWTLHLSAQGQALDIPVFVVAAVAPEQAAAKLVVCLPPPDVPAGTPGRAVYGATLLSAIFTASAITVPTAAGDYRWTSLWTPYTPGKGTPNAAGSVETQSLQHVPVKIATKVTRTRRVQSRTVKGKRVKVVTTLVRFASVVTENGAKAASATIVTTAGGKRIGGAAGSFVLVGAATKTLRVTAVADSDSGTVPTASPPAATDLAFHDLGASACVPTAIFQGLPCAGATVGGQRLTATVTVRGFAR